MRSEKKVPRPSAIQPCLSIGTPLLAAPPRQSARSEEIYRALQLRTAPIDYDTALA
jgi:hypothetical protein